MLNIIIRILLLNLLKNVKTENILALFPIPSIAAQHTITTFLYELAQRNHEITLVTSNLAFTEFSETENIFIIKLHDKLNSIWQNYNRIATSDENQDVVSEMDLNLHTANVFFEELVRNVEMKKLIDEKDSHYDLLLLEASMTPLLSLSHIFKAPVILISSNGASLDNYETVGTPIHPIMYPSIYQRRIYNLTLWEKGSSISTYVRLKLKIQSHENDIHVMLKKHFGSDFPSVNELKKNVYALFLNTNSIWVGNNPVSSNVVFMGGITPIHFEELSEDIQQFLDKSRKGVIYMSFGSNIKPSQLPPKKLLRILNVLSEVPYDVLLKWDSDRLPGMPKNIKVFKWLPQSSLLVHPKIKLFITQGGIQSTFEAINAGVPLIGIPMYSDHWYNTEKYINFNIGVQMNLAALTEEKLLDAINLVIKDESYRTAVIELRALMYEETGYAVEHALWWTEKVLRPHGRRFLRPPAANISWREYLELDFIFSLLVVLFVKLVVLIVLITMIIRYTLKSFVDIRKKIK